MSKLIDHCASSTWVQSMMKSLLSDNLPEDIAGTRKLLSSLNQMRTVIKDRIETFATKLRTLSDLNTDIIETRDVENKINNTNELLQGLRMSWESKRRIINEKIRLLEGTEMEALRLENTLLTRQVNFKQVRQDLSNDGKISVQMGDEGLCISGKIDPFGKTFVLSSAKLKEVLCDKTADDILGLNIKNVNIGHCYPDIFSLTVRYHDMERMCFDNVKDNTKDNEDIRTGLEYVLPSLKKLRKFNIKNTFLGSGANRIFEVLHSPHLRGLCLARCQLKRCGKQLVKCLAGLPVLKVLELVASGLSGHEIDDVIRCLPKSCPDLVVLYIDENNLRGHGTLLSATVRSLQNLKVLTIQDCKLCEREIQDIVASTPPSIEVMGLDMNSDIKDGQKFTTSVLSKARLRFMWTHEKQLPPQVAEKLRKIFDIRGGVLHCSVKESPETVKIMQYSEELAEQHIWHSE